VLFDVGARNTKASQEAADVATATRAALDAASTRQAEVDAQVGLLVF